MSPSTFQYPSQQWGAPNLPPGMPELERKGVVAWVEAEGLAICHGWGPPNSAPQCPVRRSMRHDQLSTVRVIRQQTASNQIRRQFPVSSLLHFSYRWQDWNHVLSGNSDGWEPRVGASGAWSSEDITAKDLFVIYLELSSLLALGWGVGGTKEDSTPRK